MRQCRSHVNYGASGDALGRGESGRGVLVITVMRKASGASPLILAMFFAGCGGGGGGGGGVNSTPAPVPAPAPAPAPSPTPMPAPVPTIRTAEYNRSNGLELSNAAPGYQAGATGRSVTAAVIDSGVAAGNAEFAGRISAASQDLAGSRGLADEGGHGTSVSAILLAAKNESQIHGVAYDATLLALRTDTPGSCTSGGCTHSDNAIARGLDVATAQGARVANISLGGSSANATLRAALGRATAAGMVVVISAGNDSQANPSDFALLANDPNARGQVLVVGSHDAGKTISSFSNRAGSTASVFLTAPGESLRTIDENGTAVMGDGTSFSAPLVSGAIALLAQAFPNLSGAQIVQLLLESADDLGTTGTDSTYGRGGLNIGRAFQPRGATSLAGSEAPINLSAEQATLSPAMGDAGSKTGMGAIILDGFDRAFAVDLARQVRNARPQSSLAGTLTRTARGASLTARGATVAVSIAAAPGGAALERLSLGAIDAVQARTTAGMIAGRIDARTSAALGFGQGAASLAGQLAGRTEPAFLVARGPADSLGFDRAGQSAATVRHQLGRLGLTASAESGTGLLFRDQPGARDLYLRSPYALFGVVADRRFGAWHLSAGLSHLVEEQTFLGARFSPLFGAAGGRSWFADGRAEWRAGGWTLGAAGRLGWSRAGDTLVRSSAFGLDLSRSGFALRLSQPLRVSGGGFALNLPISYDYATGTAVFAERRLDLSPEGRELDLEAGYSRPVFGGRLDTNLFWRREPGHYEAAPDDLGAAIRWRTDF